MPCSILYCNFLSGIMLSAGTGAAPNSDSKVDGPATQDSKRFFGFINSYYERWKGCSFDHVFTQRDQCIAFP